MIKSYISTLLVALLGVVLTANAAEDMDALLGQMDASDAGKTEEVAAPVTDSSESGMLTRLFDKGVAEYKAGNYSEAVSLFDTVLSIDRFHIDAIEYRKRTSERIAGLEVKETRTVRKQAMAEVEAAWNAGSKAVGTFDPSGATLSMGEDLAAVQKVEARLKAITLPKFDVAEATIEEVVQFFAETSRNQGGTGEDIDILLVGMEAATAENNITISVDDMSLYEAMQYVMDLASLKFEIRQNLVVIMPVNYVPASSMVMKSYDIIPEVGSDLTSDLDAGGGADDLFGASSGGGDGGPVDVAAFFSLVDFPEGSSAMYQPRFNKLFVRNTPKNIKATEAVLMDLNEKAIQRRSQQVEIQAKFVEFSEGALEELGFDWTAYGSGSVAGFEMKEGDYFQKAYGTTDSVPIADDTGLGGTLYTDPVTGQKLITEPNDRPGENVFGAAQRDNTTAFSEIGSGLLSTMGGAPGAIVLSNGDIDLRISALEQQGTADVMSAPRVTAKSGTEAIIRVAETHRYPQDYDVTTGQRTSPVVRPQDWEDFDMGVSLRVTPVVDAESNTISLELYPELMVFKGFEQYVVGYNAYDAGGNDSTAAGGDGSPFFTQMPFFERRYVETQVTIADGHTLMMGGMIFEKTDTFRDQVPILGDIPFLGRLFRTEGSRNVKNNLTIFVKASMVDPRGLTREDRELAQN